MENDQIRITWKGVIIALAVPALLITLVWALRVRDHHRREEQITAFQAYVSLPVHAQRLAPYVAAFHPNDSSTIARIQEVLHAMNMEYGPMSTAQVTLMHNGLYYHLGTNDGYSECIAPDGYKYLSNEMVRELMALPNGTQLPLARVQELNGEDGDALEAGVRVGTAALLCTAYRERFDEENMKPAQAEAQTAMRAAEAAAVAAEDAIATDTVTGP